MYIVANNNRTWNVAKWDIRKDEGQAQKFPTLEEALKNTPSGYYPYHVKKLYLLPGGKSVVDSIQ